MTEQPTIGDDLSKDGYSREEEYFHNKNRELIERLKDRSDPKVLPFERPKTVSDRRGRLWAWIRVRFARGNPRWNP